MQYKDLRLAMQFAVFTGLIGGCLPETATPPAAPYPVPSGSAVAGGLAPVAGTAGSSLQPAAVGGAGTVAVAGSVAAGAGGSGGTTQIAAAGSGGAPALVLPPGGTGQLPCQVSKALATGCQSCHGTTPQFGAPIPLVTYADLSKASRQPSLTVAQLALARINDASAPMPPGGHSLSDNDRKVLTDWLSGGAKPATAAELTTCGAGTTPPNTSTHDVAYYKNGLTPEPGETCYEFQVHGTQTPGDKTAYPVRTGEHYEQFYVKVPWGSGKVMTRFGSKFDNLKVVHHWLLFTTNRPVSQDGAHETVAGTTIGDDSQMLAGWAVGGDHVSFPSDTGLELPESGILNAQWHYFNQGAAAENDSSIIQICTMPRAMRKNIASLTFLGTEFFNGPFGMPAHTRSAFSGSCTNNSSVPVTIYGFTPHMHKLGRHMKTTVIRKATGAAETVFDKDFDFNSQITYILDNLITLQPGDEILSTCTFDNQTDHSVAFGPSTEEEMCYNFTMAYPAKKLDNGAPSLIGATNVCF